MARPKKQTVEYFPHYVTSGKTIFILENNFGNDGYAFWFKVLELLGMTDGHVYDCRNTSDWEFLLAKTHVSEDLADRILKKLADLDAIDSELWKNRIIWSDNFVQNLIPVYANRKSKPPSKPVINSRNDSAKGFLPVETSCGGISTKKTLQSKVKESKVKESKKESREKNSLLSEKIIEILKFYEEQTCSSIASQYQLVEELFEPYDLKDIKEALCKALSKGKKGKTALNYAKGILKNWADEGKEEQHGTNKANNTGPKKRATEDEGERLLKRAKEITGGHLEDPKCDF